MRKGKPSLTSLVAFGFAVVVAYFLSFGLVYALALTGHGLPNYITSPLDDLYEPIYWLGANIEWIGELNQRYIQWLVKLLDA